MVTRNVHPTGHTRLPRYARGKRGVIQRLAWRRRPSPTPTRTVWASSRNRSTRVRFEARELWGDSAEPRETVTLDLWESYLEPA